MVGESRPDGVSRNISWLGLPTMARFDMVAVCGVPTVDKALAGALNVVDEYDKLEAVSRRRSEQGRALTRPASAMRQLCWSLAALEYAQEQRRALESGGDVRSRLGQHHNLLPPNGHR